VFRYAPDDEAFHFSLSFPKSEVQKAELVSALQSVLEKLIRELHDDAKVSSGAVARTGKARAPESSV
jgi:hypothetical protein